jgi:hypothetical protein
VKVRRLGTAFFFSRVRGSDRGGGETLVGRERASRGREKEKRRGALSTPVHALPLLPHRYRLTLEVSSTAPARGPSLGGLPAPPQSKNKRPRILFAFKNHAAHAAVRTTPPPGRRVARGTPSDAQEAVEDLQALTPVNNRAESSLSIPRSCRRPCSQPVPRAVPASLPQLPPPPARGPLLSSNVLRAAPPPPGSQPPGSTADRVRVPANPKTPTLPVACPPPRSSSPSRLAAAAALLCERHQRARQSLEGGCGVACLPGPPPGPACLSLPLSPRAPAGCFSVRGVCVEREQREEGGPHSARPCARPPPPAL